MAIKSFGYMDAKAESLEEIEHFDKLPPYLKPMLIEATERLNQIDDMAELRTVFEGIVLAPDNYWTIPVYDQWHLMFKWIDGDAYQVDVVSVGYVCYTEKLL